MPLFRVHAYDDEHYATLVIQAETPDHAGRVARQFVAMMHLGYYPANHAREFPEVVRVEQASSYFDAAEPLRCPWSRASSWSTGRQSGSARPTDPPTCTAGGNHRSSLLVVLLRHFEPAPAGCAERSSGSSGHVVGMGDNRS